MTDSSTMTEIPENHCIVYDCAPVLLVGGGEVSANSLELLAVFSGKFVAADGGVAHILKASHQPEAVIGDFDSLNPDLLSALPSECLHRISEQDSTDFEKAISRIDAPLILAVGFTGGRLDHELAVLHAMLAFPERVCILIGAEDILFLAPPHIDLDLPAGTRFSVMPLASVIAESEGLRWPLGGHEYAPGFRIGTSNEVQSGAGEVAVSLDVDRPNMLVILPNEHLDRVMNSLLRVSPRGARWPARAK